MCILTPTLEILVQEFAENAMYDCNVFLGVFWQDEMEILGLAIQKSEDAAIKDHHLVAGRLAHIMQEKDQEIYHLHEQIAKLQQQLEVTTDNKVHTSVSLFRVLLCAASLKEKTFCLPPVALFSVAALI